MFKEVKIMQSKFGKQLKTVPWKFYRINIIIDIRKSINGITLMLDTSIERTKKELRMKYPNWNSDKKIENEKRM